MTSLVITHDLHAAFTIANRIAMLYKGRMIAIGGVEQIKAYQHPVLQQMLTGSTKRCAAQHPDGHRDFKTESRPSKTVPRKKKERR